MARVGHRTHDRAESSLAFLILAARILSVTLFFFRAYVYADRAPYARFWPVEGIQKVGNFSGGCTERSGDRVLEDLPTDWLVQHQRNGRPAKRRPDNGTNSCEQYAATNDLERSTRDRLAEFPNAC